MTIDIPLLDDLRVRCLQMIRRRFPKSKPMKRPDIQLEFDLGVEKQRKS